MLTSDLSPRFRPSAPPSPRFGGAPRVLAILASLGAAALLSGCGPSEQGADTATPATDAAFIPPAPDRGLGADTPTWSSARKTAVGTSYEAYVDGAYSDAAVTGPVSKVWFSIAEGHVTEVMAGLIHEAQLREVRLDFNLDGVPVDGLTTTQTWLDVDALGRPTAPVFALETRDAAGEVAVRQSIVTDPDRQALLIKIEGRAPSDVQVSARVDPALANTGVGDRGTATLNSLHAFDGDRHLVVLTSRDFVDAVAREARAGDLVAEVLLDSEAGAFDVTLAFGFGATETAARAEARSALDAGFADAFARYVGEGDHVGWRDYVESLEHLESMRRQAADGGSLANASALVLKVQEDKTHAGALIASLSNPWGGTTPAVQPATGYKGVWPRDFYQCAMAFLALGDEATARAAFAYLPRVQVTAQTPGSTGATGWFLQKAYVDGEREWVGIQLDQTAMPIMLGWKLWRAGELTEAEARAAYAQMIKPAAEFLVTGGLPIIDWNREFPVTPPLTQQERWEEQWGYSPSTTAAVVAGLVTAADFADFSEDADGAARFRAAADDVAAKIEARMFTTTGAHAGDLAGEGLNGRYFLRITRNEDPDDKQPLGENNGKPGNAEDLILDAGFLELVRYGVRAPDAASILDSLAELDSLSLPEELRVRYAFEFSGEGGPVSGWRRYGADGYGEGVETGRNYAEGGVQGADQRGRVWPFLTGERGHYELARALVDGSLTEAERAGLAADYVRALELFANEGLMLPEQVYDGVGVNPWGYALGEGTDSATPLAWAHAEYLKLLRSLSDGAVFDHYEVVASRYAGQTSVEMEGAP